MLSEWDSTSLVKSCDLQQGWGFVSPCSCQLLQWCKLTCCLWCPPYLHQFTSVEELNTWILLGGCFSTRCHSLYLISMCINVSLNYVNVVWRWALAETSSCCWRWWGRPSLVWAMKQHIGYLGTSKPRETHWMVKICHLSDIVMCVWNHVSSDGLILASHLLVWLQLGNVPSGKAPCPGIHPPTVEYLGPGHV